PRASRGPPPRSTPCPPRSTPTTRRSAAWPPTRCWRRSWPACAGPPAGAREMAGCRRRRCRSGWWRRDRPPCGGAWGGGDDGGLPQAPVSFRVVPQVLAHLRRTLGRLDEDVRRALVAVTDSP